MTTIEPIIATPDASFVTANEVTVRGRSMQAVYEIARNVKARTLWDDNCKRVEPDGDNWVLLGPHSPFEGGRQVRTRTAMVYDNPPYALRFEWRNKQLTGDWWGQDLITLRQDGDDVRVRCESTSNVALTHVPTDVARAQVAARMHKPVLNQMRRALEMNMRRFRRLAEEKR